LSIAINAREAVRMGVRDGGSKPWGGKGGIINFVSPPLFRFQGTFSRSPTLEATIIKKWEPQKGGGQAKRRTKRRGDGLGSLDPNV